MYREFKILLKIDKSIHSFKCIHVQVHLAISYLVHKCCLLIDRWASHVSTIFPILCLLNLCGGQNLLFFYTLRNNTRVDALEKVLNEIYYISVVYAFSHTHLPCRRQNTSKVEYLKNFLHAKINVFYSSL